MHSIMGTALGLGLLGTALLQAGGGGQAAAKPELTTFRDDVTHVTFGYPAAMQVNTAMMTPAMNSAREQLKGDAEAQKTLNCLTTPLVAVEGAQTLRFGVLAFTELDLTCRKQQFSPEFLTGMTKSMLNSALLKMGSTANTQEAKAYTLDGHSAAVTEGVIPAEASLSKAPIYGEAACTMVQPRVVCWVSFSGNKARVRQILGGPVKVGSGPEQALVPVGLLGQ